MTHLILRKTLQGSSSFIASMLMRSLTLFTPSVRLTFYTLTDLTAFLLVGSFNDFFYRRLKPSARPIEALDDPYRLVSAADCRLMVFATVHDATKIWIKGRDFSVARLLGDAYKQDVDRYIGGALAIFRLAPQDYHRFHSPVDGKIGKMTYISGEYYTVNVSVCTLCVNSLSNIPSGCIASSYPYSS